MISVIVCSKHNQLQHSFVENVATTIGTEYELIHIDNSTNKYSIFSAYNEGFRRSQYPYLCFVHEDVLFHVNNWGERIINHLQQPNIGIIGLAGGPVVTRVPVSWTATMGCVHIIQSDHKGIKPTKVVTRPRHYNKPRRDVVILDGVFLCMNRSLMEKLKFDESLKGFHGYDYDICIQSAVAGYTNCVIYDVPIEHFSRGWRDKTYYKNLILIFKKWQHKLPIIGYGVPKKRFYAVKRIERRYLMDFLNKLVTRGFTDDEIIEELTFFSNQIGSGKLQRSTRFMRLQIFLVRLFNKKEVDLT